MNIPKVTVANLAQGALMERIEFALAEVIDNVFDPNTEPAKLREVSVKLKVKPTKNRDQAQMTIEVTPKLAPAAPLETMLHLGRANGEPVAWEHYNPNQMTIDTEVRDDS